MEQSPLEATDTGQPSQPAFSIGGTICEWSLEWSSKKLDYIYIYLYLRRVAFYQPLSENPDLGFGGFFCKLAAFQGFGPRYANDESI